ncbi:MAG: hypothetical protein QOE33_318 [Acidobacteriota bacterium]|nr:hypothetical protein [Acidobacteriota bacterium]
MESPKLLTTCPCCGAKSCADLREEHCPSCNALAVGPPLARPERELPAYGLTAAITGAGALVAIIFAAGTAFALLAQETFSLSLWSVVAAAETSAWRLKFVLLPLAIMAACGGARALMHVSRNMPARFAGVRFAVGGFATSAMVAVVAVALIIITVPERLRQREAAREAAAHAESYDPIRVLLDYQQQYGTLPASADDLKKLPDPDGTVARAMRMIYEGQYEPESTIASLPASAKARGRRGSGMTIRSVALRAGVDEAQQGESLAFTNYTLRLAGKDRKFGTDDDILIRDGMIIPATSVQQSTRNTAPKNAP